jgi:hypothetical protein
MATAKIELFKPLIYSYFESLPNEEPFLGNKSITTWQCKSEWCKKKIAIPGSTNSNFKSHLNGSKHVNERNDYENKNLDKTPKPAKKRPRTEDEQNCLIYLYISTRKLANMLVKCCLPLSLAEHEGFREFCECLESSYKPPVRKTIKHSILPDMRKEVEKKIKP